MRDDIQECLNDPDPSNGLSRAIAIRSRIDDSREEMAEAIRELDDAIDLLDVRLGAKEPVPLTMGWVLARCQRLQLRGLRECRSTYPYRFLRPRETTVTYGRRTETWDGSPSSLRDIASRCIDLGEKEITITGGHDGSDDEGFVDYDPLIDCDWWITLTATNLVQRT